MTATPTIDVEMLSNMLNALPYAVYTFDRDRRIIFSNKTARRQQVASAPGEAIGAAQIDHFKDNEYYDESGDRLPPDKLLVLERAFQGETTHDFLIEHRNVKTRTHKWLEITCIPVMDQSGEFSYGILISRDVSLRKKREDKLRFLMESTKIISLTIEFQDRLQRKAELAVPSLADWCGIEIVNSMGKLERQAIVHRDPRKIEQIREYELRYPPKPGEESPSERVVRTGKGEFTPVVTDEMIDAVPGLNPDQREAIRALQLSSLMTLPIGRPGRVLGAFTLAYAESGRVYTQEDFNFFSEFAQHLSVLLDNARLYNEIRLRDESKDIFLASLSHELRNPLAPIRSSLELLKIQNQDPNLDSEIAVIDHQFEHMSHLLNDLLDTTRFIRGKIVVQLSPIDLMDVLDQMVGALRPVADQKNIFLSIETDNSRYPVNGDRIRLEQAFTNLLNNAIKFTPSGGVIKITAETVGQEIVIKVCDSGVGITPEEMARIFEPYYQSERVQSANPGLGIGLRLVYEIIHLHRGSLTAESEGKDKGSTFTITLPLATVEEETSSEAPTTLPAADESKRVIIVDDNQAAADGLARLLKALGWNAKALYGGRDLLALLARETIDIAFVDIGMPEMDGYDVIAEIRSQGYTLPVVALTGYGLTEDKQEALAAGFTAHLTKPVGAAELKETLAALLS